MGICESMFCKHDLGLAPFPNGPQHDILRTEGFFFKVTRHRTGSFCLGITHWRHGSYDYYLCSLKMEEEKMKERKTIKHENKIMTHKEQRKEIMKEMGRKDKIKNEK